MGRMAVALVGREAVLATVRAALGESMAGSGQLLVISGEPGIGKSALMAELTAEATSRGARVLRGACWDGGVAPAYWPWTQVLRQAVDAFADGSGPVDLGPASRLLTMPASTGEQPVEMTDPTDARFRLMEAVGRNLARIAAESPLVIALEDLQWADEPSLQLLGFLRQRLSADSVLLVATYRDAEAGPAVRALVGSGQQLPLTGLTSADVRQLMIAVATPHDGAQPPEHLVVEVWRRSGGNPFFARELTRLFLAQGGWDEGWVPAGGTWSGGAAIPDSIRDTLERRLARLTQPCAEVLEVAAVAGFELRDEVLERVLAGARDRAVLSDLLAEAADARVLVRPVEPPGRYQFSHDLYRQTIQLGLPSARRRTLHLAVARALEALRGEGGEIHLAEIAAHLLASDAEEAMADAVRVSCEAAADAMTRLGYEDAVAHYERALAATERVGDADQRVDVLLALADARYRAGDGVAARADLRRAAELARQVGDVPRLARTAVALHDLGTRGMSPEATTTLELLSEAAVALDPQPSMLRTRVLTALVRSMRHQRSALDQDRIIAAGQDAVRVARAVGEPSAVAFALLALHDALWQPGTGSQRLEVLDEMRDNATRAGERDLLVQTYQLRAAALLESGDPRGRIELARYVEEIGARGHARGRWEAMTRQATIAAISGRAAEADRIAVEAFEIGTRLGEPDAAGVHGTLRCAVWLFGNLEHGLDPFEAMLAESAPAPAYVVMLRAAAQIGHGDLTGAGQTLAGLAIDEVEPTHDLESLALLASVIAPAGSDQQRRRVYERLEPYAGLHAIVGGCASYWGAVDHHLGRLAASLGLTESALTSLESALAAYEILGAPTWAQHCQKEIDGLRADRHSSQPAETGDYSERRVFRFDGGSWELDYEGRSVHLPDAKGLRDIAVLLSTPGQPVIALTLLGLDMPGGADPILDDRARKAYRARLQDLDAEIDEAQNWHDPARAERATTERAALINELTAAAGLAGRTRLLGDHTERARKTVTARIRDALRRIERAHPELSEHLRATITTGTACEYAPASPTIWET
jgi:tetratricopeptide (TPR) repeat protein